MPQDEPDLAALAASRICHDLASPVGAALTGLDFLSHAPGGAGPDEIALLRDSLTGARAALDMLRLAFGRAGPDETLDAGKLGGIVRDHLAARPRLTLDWALDGALPRSDAQPVALAVLCAAQALPRGGMLAVARPGPARVTVTAQGDLHADPALWDGLAGRGTLPAPDPRCIEFHLLRARGARGTARIAVSSDARSRTITLASPAHD